MTNHDRAFLVAIIESPDSDAPRLQYADWLEENGQSELAEFIRVQVERSKFEWECRGGHHCSLAIPCPGCSHNEELEGRERELWDQLGPTGFNGLPDLGLTHYEKDGRIRLLSKGMATQLEFRRGFVEAITLSWANWLAHSDALLAVCPLQEVTLTTLPYIDHQANREHEYRLSGRQDGACVRVSHMTASHYKGDVVRDLAVPQLLAKEWPRIEKWNLPQPSLSAGYWSYIGTEPPIDLPPVQRVVPRTPSDWVADMWRARDVTELPSIATEVDEEAIRRLREEMVAGIPMTLTFYDADLVERIFRGDPAAPVPQGGISADPRLSSEQQANTRAAEGLARAMRKAKRRKK